ncbi:unnamed protein product, partial [Polarella glacialis]
VTLKRRRDERQLARNLEKSQIGAPVRRVQKAPGGRMEISAELNRSLPAVAPELLACAQASQAATQLPTWQPTASS